MENCEALARKWRAEAITRGGGKMLTEHAEELERAMEKDIHDDRHNGAFEFSCLICMDEIDEHGGGPDDFDTDRQRKVIRARRAREAARDAAWLVR